MCASDRVTTRPTASWIDNDSGALFKSFSTYLVTNVLRVGLPFLLLPFLTAYLTPAEYGVLALFQALVQFVLPFTADERGCRGGRGVLPDRAAPTA